MDMCSLAFSYIGFILGVLSYAGGSNMDVLAAVVIGVNMVGYQTA